jgi:glycosyltransferase involved in cell wall biosynthesis
MNISYINYIYNVSGSARGAAHQVESIAKELRNLGHTVNVHYRAAKQDEKSDSNVSANKPGIVDSLKKISILRRFLNVPKKLLRNFPHVGEEKRIIKADNADVLLIVGTYMNFSGMSAARAFNIPYVVFCDAPMHYEYSLFWKQYQTYGLLGRHYERLMLKRAAHVTCLSDTFKGYLVNYGIPADKVSVVPNGADLALFDEMPPNQDLVEKYNLKGKTVAGFVGSFNFFDDVNIVGNIFKRLCRKFSDLLLLFVGKGKAGEQLQSVLSDEISNNQAVFTGALPHMEAMEHLGLMDLVFSPYKGDYLFYGSSMKIIEYMAAGKPVIATALGQIKELIHHGCNGMLFDWQEYETLEALFQKLIENKELRLKLGNSARETIANGWTWKHQALKIEKILLKAIKAHGAKSGQLS